MTVALHIGSVRHVTCMDQFFPDRAPSTANFTTHTRLTFRLICTSNAINTEATKEPIHAVTAANQPQCSQTVKTKTELSLSPIR